MYWKDIRSEAWARTKLKMLSRERRLLSLAGPLISAGIAVGLLSVFHQPIPLSIAITVVSAFGGFAVVVAWEWLVESFAIPAERHESQERIIQEKDKKIAELSPTDRRYTELQLTKLARLKQEGGPLFEHHIIPNQNQSSVARQELQTLLENHREWRKEISGILNERDATVFEAPTIHKINFHAPGLPAPYNAEHSRMRHQLFNELSRLEEILKEAWSKFLNKQ
jgi:multidrug transporter EmrE-like cation transporter